MLARTSIRAWAREILAGVASAGRANGGISPDTVTIDGQPEVRLTGRRRRDMRAIERACYRFLRS